MALWILSFVALFILLAWRPRSLRSGLLGFAALLLAFTFHGPALPELKALLWLIYLAGLSAWLLPAMRRDCMLRPAMRWMGEHVIPALPETRMGTQGWTSALLQGRADWHRLRALPLPRLESAEQAYRDGLLQTLSEKLGPEVSPDQLHTIANAYRLTNHGLSASAHASVLAGLSSLPAGLTLAEALAGALAEAPDTDSGTESPPPELSDEPRPDEIQIPRETTQWVLPALCSGALQGLSAQALSIFRTSTSSSAAGLSSGVKQALAELAAQTYASRAVSRFAAAARDWGEARETQEAGQALAQWCAGRSLQAGLQAASQIQQALELDPGLTRSLWTELPRLVNAAQAGLDRPAALIGSASGLAAHPYWAQLADAVTRADEPRCAHLLGRHAGRLTNLAVRCIVYGSGGTSLAPAPALPCRPHYQRLSRYIDALAMLNEWRILLGRRGNGLESPLGEVLARLFQISACLKHYEDQGCLPDEHQLLDWLCAQAWLDIEARLQQALVQLPGRGLRALGRLLVFPIGTQGPSDMQICRQRVLMQITQDGPARQRLIADAFVCLNTGS